MTVEDRASILDLPSPRSSCATSVPSKGRFDRVKYVSHHKPPSPGFAAAFALLRVSHRPRQERFICGRRSDLTGNTLHRSLLMRFRMPAS